MTILRADPSSLVTACILVLLGYFVSLAVYRLFLHPLAGFPGPKMAALTHWYDFYYEINQFGKLHKQLNYLHGKYGPIIRLSPDELHVSDPDFWVELFTKQGPQYKYSKTANIFANYHSTFTALDPDLHKSRRAAMEGLFTRPSVRQLLPVLQANTAKMIQRLGEYIKSILHDVFMQAGSAGKIGQQFPVIPRILNALPDWLVIKLQPDFLPLVKMKRVFLDDYITLRDSDGAKARSNRLGNSVLLQVFKDPNLPSAEKSAVRIQDESQLVIGAGLTTTGWAATVATYYILNNPDILQKLRAELFTVVPKGKKRADCTDLDWAALEALPYFQACIKEAIRLSYGMSSRGTRITPKDIVYTEADYYSPKGGARSWTIPANTPVSMSSPVTSHVEHIFKDSHKFDPERWLGPNKIPDKYFVTFGKGSRICLGMQLAWAELSLMLASIFRWYDVELYDTDVRCVALFTDIGVPIPERDTGVRAIIKAEIE